MKADTMSDDVVEAMALAAMRAVVAQDFMMDAGAVTGTKIDWLDQSETDFMPVAQAALEAIRSAGYVVVPAEPTEAMVSAGAQDFSGDLVTKRGAIDIYRAMIAEAEGK